MFLLILFFIVSIFFSFLCSILEAVILSVTPAYVNRHVQAGDEIGTLLKLYKEDIDKPLSAILTLNTIAHTVGAIGVGAQAGALFGTNSFDLGLFSVSYESIIATIMTLAILILSEIIPKTIGANYWEQLAPFTVRTLRVLLWILSPFVWVSQWITKRLKKDKDRSVLSRADFTSLAMLGAESGTLDHSESTIIQNLLRLEHFAVRDIMTPRSVMTIANQEDTLEFFFNSNRSIPFSRIPLYHTVPDNIVGFFLKDDLYLALAEDKHENKLSSIRREILFVKDSENLTSLFQKLVHDNEHIAIVTDEYGSVVGIVSMEDVFETLLGLEIVDESDTVENLQHLARKKWEARDVSSKKSDK